MVLFFSFIERNLNRLPYIPPYYAKRLPKGGETVTSLIVIPYTQYIIWNVKCQYLNKLFLQSRYRQYWLQMGLVSRFKPKLRFQAGWIAGCGYNLGCQEAPTGPIVGVD